LKQFVVNAGYSIRAPQSPHREFDAAIGKFAPAFDLAHIGLLREPIEESAGRATRGLTRLGKPFADEPAIQPQPRATLGHSVREVPWRIRHRRYSRQSDAIEIVIAKLTVKTSAAKKQQSQ
jgi:hypothetical protein